MKISDICNILDVKLTFCDKEISGIAHIKRCIKEGCAFFAMKTWRVDTYSNIEEARRKKAAVIITEKYINDYPCIVVEDTYKAFMKVCEWCRMQKSLKVVAVTGSIGKTSTKEMIFSALSKGCSIAKSKENGNSSDLVAMNVCNVTEDVDVLVQEVAIKDIHYSSVTMQPSIAVITNIGYSHVEEFGSIENICVEKLKISDGLRKDGKLVLNYDDKFLREYGDKSNYDIVSYGIEEEASYRAINIEVLKNGYRFTILHNDVKYPVELSCFGKHNISNALASFAVGQSLGIPDNILLSGIKEFAPTGIRQNVFEKNGVTVIADCFNAAPDSMKSALDMLDSIDVAGKKIAVLGDMLEMGKYSRMLHNQVGEYINTINIDEVLLFGEHSKYIAEAINDDKKVTFVQRRDCLISMLKTLSKEKGNVILFKASHGIMLESVIDELFGTKYYNAIASGKYIWDALDREGYDVNRYFVEKGLKQVAVYGLSSNGTATMDFLKKHNIEVKYAIDNKAKYLPENAYDMPVYDLQRNLELVDAIIVALDGNYKMIKQNIMAKFHGNVIWYKDMIDEIVNKY